MKPIHYGNANKAQRDFIELKMKQELGWCQTQLIEKCLTIVGIRSDDLMSPEEIINAIYTEDEDHEQYDEESAGEGKEIMEWWQCTEYFAEKLKETDEAVLENEYGSWWGRTCSGQGIVLDPTFWIIFQDSIQNLE